MFITKLSNSDGKGIRKDTERKNVIVLISLWWKSFHFSWSIEIIHQPADKGEEKRKILMVTYWLIVWNNTNPRFLTAAQEIEETLCTVIAARTTTYIHKTKQ